MLKQILEKLSLESNMLDVFRELKYIGINRPLMDYRKYKWSSSNLSAKHNPMMTIFIKKNKQLLFWDIPFSHFEESEQYAVIYIENLKYIILKQINRQKLKMFLDKI